MKKLIPSAVLFGVCVLLIFTGHEPPAIAFFVMAGLFSLPYWADL